MQNNDKKGKLPFSFTDLPSIEEKIEKIEQPEVKKIIEGAEEKSSAVEKVKAMQQFGLREDEINLGGPVSYSQYKIFKKIVDAYQEEDRYEERSKRKNWSQKTLAAHYILEGIKRDMKKIKNN
jgi:hypothetical protein